MSKGIFFNHRMRIIWQIHPPGKLVGGVVVVPLFVLELENDSLL